MLEYGKQFTICTFHESLSDTDCETVLFWNSAEKSPRKTPPKSARFLEVSSKFEPGYPSRESWFGWPPSAQTEERCLEWRRLMPQICLFWRCWSTAWCQAVLLHQVNFFFKMLHLVKGSQKNLNLLCPLSTQKKKCNEYNGGLVLLSFLHIFKLTVDASRQLLECF